VVFSAAGGLVPVALIDGAPRHAPRPELVGATLGFLMQGNNVGLLLGPVIAGALAAAFGWPMVSSFVAALAFAAALLALALRREADRQPSRNPAGAQEQPVGGNS
jgi:MFS family permease